MLRRHLLLVARDDGAAVDPEFAAASDDINLEEDRLVLHPYRGRPVGGLRRRATGT